jgi:hypothetical protein
MKFFSREPGKSEEVKNNQEGKNIAQPQGVSRRNFLVGAAALATMQAAPALAQDEQKIVKLLVGDPKTYGEINALVVKYIQNLGTLSKWSLVRDLKAKADTLIAILKSESNVNSPLVGRLIGESKDETKVILTTYIDGIKRLPESEKVVAVTKITDLVQMIKVTDISDIEKKLV